MIKKLIISAVVLTALIHGREANAAGPGGFARDLARVSAIHIQTGENRAAARPEIAEEKRGDAGFAKQQELAQVNAAVNRAIYDVDSFFEGFDKTTSIKDGPKNCFDCADIKRDQLISLGWSADAMRIAYVVDAQGRFGRVLVVKTGSVEMMLGDDSPIVEISHDAASPAALEIQAPAIPTGFNI